MKSKHIKQIKFCLPKETTGINKDKAISQIIENIEPTREIGFAGYKNKEFLKSGLKFNVFGETEETDLPDLEPYKEKIEIETEKALSKYNKVMETPDINVFVFPSQDTFVEKQMKGVTGIWIYKTVIHIFINTDYKEWLKQLPNTVIHETSHVISGTTFKWDAILDSIIFEGITEHFREKVLNDNKQEPWTKAISNEKAVEILKELEENNHLNKKDDTELYRDLFFGIDKYPQWSGYTIGYVIIDKILKNTDKDITGLIKMPPKKVFETYKNL